MLRKLLSNKHLTKPYKLFFLGAGKNRKPSAYADRNILTSLSIALEKEGFKVQTYIDGESALIGLSRTPPDLAVIDIKMPKMDGEELLRKLSLYSRKLMKKIRLNIY